jgi:cysteine desulfurase
MRSDWTYLDYNASTPMADEVVEQMKESLNGQAHPSSPHPHGRAAAAVVEKARGEVAQALGCKPDEIVFGSGSTEAANHVIKGVCFAQASPDRHHFISSLVDHSATVEPLKFLEKLGHEVTFLPVDHLGRLEPSDVRDALRPNTVLVSLIHGQNEIGTVQPLRDIGEICRGHRALFHVDASQSFGKVPVDVNELSADFLNIAGHKIYGPKGVGALYIRDGRQLEPLLHGGGHENGRRSGTPAPQLVSGLGRACRLVQEVGLLSEVPTSRLWELLSSELGSKVRRNGHPTDRLPNVLHLTFDGINGRELLNIAKISASTGAACHSATVSPVLKALGFSAEEAAGSVRLSCGRQTTLETAELAAQAIVEAYAQMTTPVPNH